MYIFYILPHHYMLSHLRSVIRNQLVSMPFKQMSHSSQLGKKTPTHLHSGRKKGSLCSLPQAFLPKWNLGLHSKIKQNLIAGKLGTSYAALEDVLCQAYNSPRIPETCSGNSLWHLHFTVKLP